MILSPLPYPTNYLLNAPSARSPYNDGDDLSAMPSAMQEYKRVKRPATKRQSALCPSLRKHTTDVLCIFLWALVLVGFLLLNILVITSVGGDGSGRPWSGGASGIIDQRKFTLRLNRQYAEQSGLCDRVDVDGDVSKYNATVLRLCRELRRDEADFYRKRPRRVNRFRHNFLLDGRKICRTDTEVIVLIHSLHLYEERRRGIRQTWGTAVQTKTWPRKKPVKYNVSVGFVFGYHRNDSWNIKVYKESKEHNDIIMGDFIEDYKNMTLKSLLGLKWVKTYCPHVKYVIKSDDDMIINFPYLFSVLDGANMTRAIMGPINVGSKVLRRGKWKLTSEEFPFFYFPPYESGSCYIINGDLVSSLYLTSEYVPWIFIDDVYITGIVGKIVGVQHLEQKGFAYWNSPKPKVCDLVRNDIITGTKMITVYLKTLWKKLHERQDCPDPTTTNPADSFL